MLRASSLPALQECPCFESGDTAYTESGTDRHTALKHYFDSDDSLLNMLPDDERDGVLWAAEYIKTHANMTEHGIRWEERIAVTLDDFTDIPGTPDAVCHLDIFDLKWRDFDYAPQMACYALARLQELGIDATIRVHLLFACFKRAQVLTFDRQAAERIIGPIAKRVTAPDRQPTPCSYCGWCANRLTCSALNERVQAVAAGREDWKLQQYHTSQITDPNEMAKALELASLVEEWAAAVKYHAKDMAIKQGITIPGYALKSKAGRRSIHDMTGAFNALGIPAEQFLQCCDVRMTTSKTNPDQKGIEDIYAAAKGIPKAAAKKELKKKLAPFTRTPKEVLYLAKSNTTETEE